MRSDLQEILDRAKEAKTHRSPQEFRSWMRGYMTAAEKTSNELNRELGKLLTEDIGGESGKQST